MSKVFSFYSDDIDKSWYSSSTVKFSRCIDHDNALKTLFVVFKNGTCYKYSNVNVQDYLKFRESASQGKALNEFIKSKGYEYEKTDNVDIDKLDEELNFRLNDGIYVIYDNGLLELKNNSDSVIFKKEIVLSEDVFNTICSVLESVGKRVCGSFNKQRNNE